MSDFCAANPKAAVCKGDDESQWGGACAGGFTCKGDAVQCAQAQASYDLSCSMKTDPQNSTVFAGNSAIGAGNRPDGHPANDAGVIPFQLSSMISSVPMFGSSGSCISDKTFTFVGSSYTLPFSSWCPYLQMLGAAFLASCYMAAAFIVFKGD
ncbi:virulence factor TspB C-terminal domain-related protein [Aquabacterium sp. CECT 9606]|uniref:virulence factor TspB C-terminal domain-related protein n=1 Tax=Aquabacterium sp. CECT 9606 TaxID=2845822 RepID=UPI001E3D0E92|nr:virulence factor TspB C-terminal domain-related protein [Aquabacterium sp. CECT 9606]